MTPVERYEAGNSAGDLVTSITKPEATKWLCNESRLGLVSE